MSSGTRVAPKLLFFLLFTAYFLHLPAFAHGGVSGGSTEMKPVVSPGLRSMLLNETRRRLGSFQVCALCTCCGGPRGLCLPSPCCYAINCNIPNRPFGFCSFTPKACNCFGCSL